MVETTNKAKFTSGNTMRHVIVMTTTSSVGLVSVFFVDALNLFYISMLGQQELAAAIGYAYTVLFFSISISIGLTIAASALVARTIGAGEAEKARRLATSSVLYIIMASVLLATVLYLSRYYFLSLLGATGETLKMSADFLRIVIPSIPLLGLGMLAGALLRSQGDAKRAMYVTLAGAITALIVDPLLIFGLDLGITGAAFATVITRIVIFAVGYHGVQVVHSMLGRVSLADVASHFKPLFTIALPALATQLATPVGNAYVTYSIAPFGDDAVAGWAIVGRLVPVAFGVVFALSGAVGPIIGQNYGAKLIDRVMQTMRDALLFSLLFCVGVWALLALGNGWIVWLFDAQGDAASMIRSFCFYVAGTFVFTAALFVSNAAFNNLGHPLYATSLNWGRATLGTIPFVYVGSAWGANGILIAWGLGGVAFGILGAIGSFWIIKKLPDREIDETAPAPSIPPSANSPFTTGKGASS